MEPVSLEALVEHQFRAALSWGHGGTAARLPPIGSVPTGPGTSVEPRGLHCL